MKDYILNTIKRYVHLSLEQKYSIVLLFLLEIHLIEILFFIWFYKMKMGSGSFLK